MKKLGKAVASENITIPKHFVGKKRSLLPGFAHLLSSGAAGAGATDGGRIGRSVRSAEWAQERRPPVAVVRSVHRGAAVRGERSVSGHSVRDTHRDFLTSHSGLQMEMEYGRRGIMYCVRKSGSREETSDNVTNKSSLSYARHFKLLSSQGTFKYYIRNIIKYLTLTALLLMIRKHQSRWPYNHYKSNPIPAFLTYVLLHGSFDMLDRRATSLFHHSPGIPVRTQAAPPPPTSTQPQRPQQQQTLPQR